ncbi:uncharacterized protein [Dysidea avara]|uniref:uncharacterized protein n=1 Tax=Dysidea avara TaxID=196820 RepID=UPI00331900E9
MVSYIQTVTWIRHTMAVTTVNSGTSEMLINKLGLIAHPEGGFFLETHRSGSGRPMTVRGETDLNVPEQDLVMTNRTGQRQDRDGRRNALTSIYWMPTGDSPILNLSINLSDHVHYYHGGVPFEFIFFDPTSGELSRVVLGGDVMGGQVFQLPVKGGTWKCGHMIVPESADEESKKDMYTLIGEAVAPGFDFHDFTWVTAELIHKIAPQYWNALKSFLHDTKRTDSLEGNARGFKDSEWTNYYDDYLNQ